MNPGVTKDRGWAWMVVLGAFLVNMLVVGVTAKSFGILFERLKETLDHSSSATLFIVAISQCLSMVLGPFANMLVMRFTSRWVVFTGGIIISCGFVLSMFTTTIYQLYFTYGVLVGIGSAMAYAPSIVTTTQYFDKRKALANGIAVAGGGIGNFIAPPLIQQLLEWYDLSGSFLILAALMLHICLSGALFRPFVYSTLPKKQAEAPPKSDSLLTPANHEKVLNQYDADTCETLCHLGEKADSVHLLPKPPDCQSELKSDTMPHKTGQPKSDIVLEPDKSKSDTVQAADKPKSGTELYLDEGYGTSTEKSDITVPSESQESPGTTPTTHIPAGNGYVTDQNVDIERPRCCTSAWCNSCCAVTTPHGGKRPVFEWQLLKNSVFLIYGFSMFFAFSGYPNVFMIIVSHAMQMDIDRSRATFLVSIIGIFDVVGRIGFGWFSDLNLIRKKHGFMITMAIAGLACMLMPVVGHSYVGLSILCAIFGLFAGSFYALLPAILVEGLGEKKLLSAFGLVTLFMGTAFIYATFVVGRLNDITGEWSKSFYFSGSAMILGSLIVLLEPLAVQHEQRKQATSQLQHTDDTKVHETANV